MGRLDCTCTTIPVFNKFIWQVITYTPHSLPHDPFVIQQNIVKINVSVCDGNFQHYTVQINIAHIFWQRKGLSYLPPFCVITFNHSNVTVFLVAFTSNQVYVCSYKKKRVISLRIETRSRKFNKKARVCAIGIYRQFKYFKAISGLQNIIKKDRVSE